MAVADAVAPDWPTCACGQPVRRIRNTHRLSGPRRPNPDGRCKRCALRHEREEKRRHNEHERQLRAIAPIDEALIEPDRALEVESALASRDMRPIVRLRALLTRDKGGFWGGVRLSFEESWRDSVEAAILDLTDAEKTAYRLLFASTRAVWESAYNDTPSALAHWRVDGGLLDAFSAADRSDVRLVA